MYTIHTTPGFIIESRPSGEAGKLLSIFTRDLGLVFASAQGIRLEKSKLRYHSQELSFGEFSFVRGKEYWRLTNADETQSKEGTTEIRKNNSALIGRIALLLRRLLHGEEANPELFEHVEQSFDFLNNFTDQSGVSAKLSPEQLQTFESVVVFRILHLLGYVGTDKKLSEKVFIEKLSIELLDELKGQRAIVNQHINKALRESHL